MIFECVRLHSRLLALKTLQGDLDLLRKTWGKIEDMSITIRAQATSAMIGQEPER
jgi:hypothetical protein